jgi:hypothetical protein
VSDNGSTDGSQDIALRKGARLVHCPKKGYGNALIHGISMSKGDVVVMGDSDGSHNFFDAVLMVERIIGGADICMGDRFHRNSHIESGSMRWKNRYVGNPVLTKIFNTFFRNKVSDVHCGLRAFSKAAFLRINPCSEGMEFASELLVKASLLKMRIEEVPVSMLKDGRSRPPHLRPWRDGWRHLRYLLMLSPTWLYFIPALACMGIGLFILVAQALAPEDKPLALFAMTLGDHWSVIAGFTVVFGHAGIMLGMTALFYGIRHGFRLPIQPRLVRAIGIDRMCLAGVSSIVLAVVIFSFVVREMYSLGFDGLDMINEVTLCCALFFMGAQNIFFGFILSIVNDNKCLSELAVGQTVHRHSIENTLQASS